MDRQKGKFNRLWFKYRGDTQPIIVDTFMIVAISADTGIIILVATQTPIIQQLQQQQLQPQLHLQAGAQVQWTTSWPSGL